MERHVNLHLRQPKQDDSAKEFAHIEKTVQYIICVSNELSKMLSIFQPAI